LRIGDLIFQDGLLPNFFFNGFQSKQLNDLINGAAKRLKK